MTAFAVLVKKRGNGFMYVTKYAEAFACGENHRLLVNLLTGAVDLVGNELFTEIVKLEGQGECNIGPDDLAALIDRGYVFESADFEKELFETMRQEYLSMVEQEAFSFWLCPTYGCNMQCSYCFEGNSRDNFSIITPKNITAAFAAMDQLNTAIAPPTLHIYGGEPLLNGTQSAVAEIIEQAALRGYVLNIITNGTSIPQFIDVLKEHRQQINYVQITLDGIAAIHDQNRVDRSMKGTFDRVVAGVDLLMESEVPVQIRSNLSREGVEKYAEFIGFAKAKGWLNCPTMKCYFTMVNNRHCADAIDCLSEVEIAQALIAIRKLPDSELVGDFDTTHILDSLLVNLGYVTNRGIGPKFHFCNAGWGKLFVFGPDGAIYPCPSAAGDHSMTIGSYAPQLDINDELFDPWKFESVDKLERCEGCRSMLTCGGGCPFKALKLSHGQSLCDNPITIIRDFVASVSEEILNRGDEGEESL